MKSFATCLLASFAAAQTTYNGGTDAYPTAVTSYVMDLSNTFVCSPAWDPSLTVTSTAFNTIFDTLKNAGVSGVMLPFFPATATFGADGKTSYNACNGQVKTVMNSATAKSLRVTLVPGLQDKSDQTTLTED